MNWNEVFLVRGGECLVNIYIYDEIIYLFVNEVVILYILEMCI